MTTLDYLLDWVELDETAARLREEGYSESNIARWLDRPIATDDEPIETDDERRAEPAEWDRVYG